MSEDESAPKGAQGPAGQFWGRPVTATLERLWAAYLKRRIEHQAFAHLRSMSDGQLQDIAFVRSQIAVAVWLGLDRERPRTVSPF